MPTKPCCACSYSISPPKRLDQSKQRPLNALMKAHLHKEDPILRSINKASIMPQPLPAKPTSVLITTTQLLVASVNPIT